MTMATDNSPSRYVAIDMGAESARAMVGNIANGTIRLEELRRWPSRSMTVNGTAYWDVLFMFDEIKHALRQYAEQYGPTLAGIGVDSWGVDFGILGSSGQLLQNPVQYRDHRTDGLLDQASRVLPRDAIYRETGIAFLPFNTLYQLWAVKRSAPELLQNGGTFLMMPDLIHYFLSGVSRCEYTNASTTQLLNVESRQWSQKIFNAFDLPIQMMPEIVPPGTVLGSLLPQVTDETGVHHSNVVAPCTHDTGSAVLAIPATERDVAYISCGTWSLLGAELDAPCTIPAALACNFTNEGGYDGTIRFLKNLMGLWVLQQARESWKRRGESYEYAELAEMAKSAPAFTAIINIDKDEFLHPDDMLDAIAAECAATNQPVPGDVGTTVRVILESLAVRYADSLADLENVTGRKFDMVHLVGGGTRNELLCQWASDAMNRPVIAGPAECTAMGNILTQALGTGVIANRQEARKMVIAASELTVYEPADTARWKPYLKR
jgi:rhamnulokinase